MKIWGITKKQAMRAECFKFGFCNACERYACGESTSSIIATPTKEAVVVTTDESYAVTREQGKDY